VVADCLIALGGVCRKSISAEEHREANGSFAQIDEKVADALARRGGSEEREQALAKKLRKQIGV